MSEAACETQQEKKSKLENRAEDITTKETETIGMKLWKSLADLEGWMMYQLSVAA